MLWVQIPFSFFFILKPFWRNGKRGRFRFYFDIGSSPIKGNILTIYVRFKKFMFFIFMLNAESKIKVADNSGAKKVKIIKKLGSSSIKNIRLNDLVSVVVQVLLLQKQVQKKKIYFGLIISTRYKNLRVDGSFLKFDNNRVVLFSNMHKFLGTRLYGPITKELKFYLKYKTFRDKFQKLISYASNII